MVAYLLINLNSLIQFNISIFNHCNGSFSIIDEMAQIHILTMFKNVTKLKSSASLLQEYN